MSFFFTPSLARGVPPWLLVSPDVELPYLPTWLNKEASWLCLLFGGLGRTQSTVPPKPARQAPEKPPEIYEYFQSWPAMPDICAPELETFMPHSKPTGPVPARPCHFHFPSFFDTGWLVVREGSSFSTIASSACFSSQKALINIPSARLGFPSIQFILWDEYICRETSMLD